MRYIRCSSDHGIEAANDAKTMPTINITCHVKQAPCTEQQKTRAQLTWENSSTNLSLIFATRINSLHWLSN